MSLRCPAGLTVVGAAIFAVGAGITRADVAVLCADFAELLRTSGGDLVVLDVAAVQRPDLVLVDALARFGLTARRQHRRMVVRGATPALHDLAGLLGLGDLLAVESGG